MIFSKEASECIRVCFTVLEKEDELSLAYLFGEWPERYALRESRQPKYTGVPLRLAAYLKRMLTLVAFSMSKSTLGSFKDGSFKVLAFAGTPNQYHAIRPSVQFIDEQLPTLLLYKEKVAEVTGQNEKAIPVTLSPSQALVSVFLSAKSLPLLYRKLKAIDLRLPKWRLDSFLEAHLWLVYSWALLSKIKPRYVLVSNDHNTANRAFIAMAHHLGIKTIYMQHASVSSIFPALRFNYAFLDGRIALGHYVECEKNRPSRVAEYPVPVVVLSGQKKNLTKNISTDVNCLAIAINAGDRYDFVLPFCSELVDKGQRLIIRWHPFQREEDVEAIKTAFSDHNGMVSFSDPMKQELGVFFAHARCLIAGNSSIHLEAALFGLKTIYFEWSTPMTPDYYGYVKNGVSVQAFNVDDVLGLVGRAQSDQDDSLERSRAIQQYSETYGTVWEGREGELVAKVLASMEDDVGLGNDFLCEDHGTFAEVWLPKALSTSI